MVQHFTKHILALIKRVPPGKVATYGQIAAYAGNPRAARQVVRILHTLSRQENLPWHRIINSKGRISLKPGLGYEEQRFLLTQEGVEFNERDIIDLERFIWQP
ncbi:MGMT family protein [candidate division CSSED10-310 bacterium]|uniref:MGMT family protein n=1 Tax=candidate division CSSED10-310 bacterium TaxID=2855610 RepID=A0ABV6YVG2_UNCC1